MNNIAQELQEAATLLLTPLRQGRGLDAVAADRLRSALRAAASASSESEDVPKAAANLFVDLANGIEACSYAYEPDEASRIRALADEIADLIRACLS